MFELANRFVAPSLFACVEVRPEWLGPRRVAVHGRVLDGYRASVPFFKMCHANVVDTPRVLDLPAARVEEEWTDGRTGRLVLVLPPSHTVLARMKRSAHAAWSLGEVLRGIERHESGLEASLEALRASRREMQALIEQLPDGVLVHRGGVVCWVNEAMARIVMPAGHEERLVFCYCRGRAIVEKDLNAAVLEQFVDAIPALAETAIRKQANAQRAPRAVHSVDGNSAHRIVYAEFRIEQQHRQNNDDSRHCADDDRGEWRDECARRGDRYQAGEHPVAQERRFRFPDFPIQDNATRYRGRCQMQALC